MVKKVCLFAACSAVAGAIIVAPLLSGAAAPEKVVIKEVQKAQPPVEFNHKKHEGIAENKCVTCHHKWDQASGKEPEKCTVCHKETQSGNTPSAKDAFHKQCKSCHEKNKEKGAPTACKDCHKK